ncbi:unnamed protein product [Discosporangium mesarthrocarpum]
MRKAIYMFGGVIVGPGAREVAKTLDHIPHTDGSTSGEESDGDAKTPRDDERQFDGEKNDVAGLKRKSPGSLLSPHPDHRRGDATPQVPGGWAADQAKAASQGCTSLVSECELPTDKGHFRLRAYRYTGPEKSHEPVVMIAGDVRGREHLPVRVHDQCQTSEVFGSKRCDCREQLDQSLRYVQEHGGAVIYLHQEGRGIGLANKVAAYDLQDQGLDTVDANRKLGFDDDHRTYECVNFILKDMGVKSVRLMTNNPYKIDWLKATGVTVTGRIPVVVPPNQHNQRYLDSKAQRMSHLINSL